LSRLPGFALFLQEPCHASQEVSTGLDSSPKRSFIELERVTSVTQK